VTVYIRDEKADAIVSANAKMQDAVQGRSILLWLPGQTAGLSVNLCLMFGWMGAVISVYRMAPVLRQTMGWYALGICVLSLAMGVHWFMLVRGHRAGRSRMYWHAIATLAVGAVITAVALLRSDWVAAGLAGVGVIFSMVAQRLIAGPSYALFAAFYRAKRAYDSPGGGSSPPDV
jgi:hypothetical protein